MSKFIEFRSGCSCKKKKFLIIIPDIGYPACHYERITTSPFIRQTFAGFVFEPNPKATHYQELLQDLTMFMKKFNKKKPVVIAHGLSHILVRLLALQPDVRIEQMILLDPIFQPPHVETNQQRIQLLEEEFRGGVYFGFRFRRAFHRFDFPSLLRLTRSIQQQIQEHQQSLPIPTVAICAQGQQHHLANIKSISTHLVVEEMGNQHSLHIGNPQVLANIFSKYM